MTQKIIQVGNSLGITLPKEFVKQHKLSAGQNISTNIDVNSGILSVQKDTQKSSGDVLKSRLSPEFINRVDSFIKRHRTALEKLSEL